MIMLNTFQADALELELRDEADLLEATLDQYKRDSDALPFVKGIIKGLRDAASRVHVHAYEKPQVDRILSGG